MYVLTTEIWPLGNYKAKRSILQIIGYNTQRETPEGLIWYENIVSEDSNGEVNSTEEIRKAFEDWKLDSLKGVSINVLHDRKDGMAILITKILAEYAFKSAFKYEKGV